MAWKKILLEGDAPALSETAPVNVDHAAAAAGTATEASKQDHKHDLNEGTVGTIAAVDGSAAALGTDNAVPHLDHVHPLGPLVADLDFDQHAAASLIIENAPAASPPDSGTEVEGEVYYQTDDDHPYIYQAAGWKQLLLSGDAAVLSDTAPVDVDKSAAAAGSAAEASRQDHKHDIATATPGNITEGATAAEGSSASLARADHTHGSPSDWTPKAHAASHKDAGADEILLNELGEPTAAVNINQQQLDGAVLEAVATAPDAGAEVEGQIYFNTTAGDKHPYVWVSA